MNGLRVLRFTAPRSRSISRNLARFHGGFAVAAAILAPIFPRMPGRIFLLSPARCDGRRADLLFNEPARFDLAKKLRTAEGAAIGEVFSFLSGLYFRAKLKYAAAFGARVEGELAAFVITQDRGLVPPFTRVTLDDLRAMAAVDINPANPRYRGPLEHDAVRLRDALPPETEVVLLGSVATVKYVEPLGAIFGERLFFPQDFAGRGDMSRGGLLLRCIDAGEELQYVSLGGATRHGARPARLFPRRRIPKPQT